MTRYPKRHFYTAFAVFVIVVAGLQRLCHFNLPAVASDAVGYDSPSGPVGATLAVVPPEEETVHNNPVIDNERDDRSSRKRFAFSAKKGRPYKAGSQATGGHRASVWSYTACFPDIQDTQIQAAMEAGITPVATAEEIDDLVRQHRLVSILASPYYTVEPLTHSLPYVVPRAQMLLNVIGINFIDACIDKGLPPHLPVVTSVLRTTEQVARLQRGNSNATTNSCHCYGTTFDIAYTRFQPLTGNPNDSTTRWDDALKLTLAEVLYDLRADSLCYIKYEHKQACFHMTVR